MTLVLCTVPEFPCQATHQVEITEATLEDLAAIGITPQSVSLSVGVGFALVLSLAMLGYGLGVVLRMVRKL